MEWFTLLFQILITLTILLSNIVIVVLIKRGSFIKKSTSYIFISFIAVSDFVYGASNIIRMLLLMYQTTWQCKIALFFMVGSGLCSASGIFMASLDLLLTVTNVWIGSSSQKRKYRLWFSAVCISFMLILTFALFIPAVLLSSESPTTIDGCRFINPHTMNQSFTLAGMLIVTLIYIATTVILFNIYFISHRAHTTSIKRQKAFLFSTKRNRKTNNKIKGIMASSSKTNLEKELSKSTTSSNDRSTKITEKETHSPSALAQSDQEVFSISSRSFKQKRKVRFIQTDDRSCDRIRQRHLHLTKIIGLIWLCFTITWVPYIISFFVISIGKVNIPRMVMFTLGMIISLNAFCNFIIYMVKSKDFRKEFKRLLLPKRLIYR